MNKSRKITAWLKSFRTCRERTGIVVRRPEALGMLYFLAETYRRILGSIVGRRLSVNNKLTVGPREQQCRAEVYNGGCGRES